jgi:hypothetical protein
MSDVVDTPKVAKTIEEAKARLKKVKKEKIDANTKDAKNKRGY